MTPPRVLVLDDDPAVLDAMSIRLRLAGAEVDAYDDPKICLRDACFDNANCMFLDIHLPEIDGLAVMAAVLERTPWLPIIIMTGHGDVGTAVRSMKEGAHDFLGKPFGETELLDVLERATAAGREQRERHHAAGVAATDLAHLTPREREVMDLLMAGDPNKIIAYKLGCSGRTVEIHRARVMKKMKVRNLAELAQRALQSGS